MAGCHGPRYFGHRAGAGPAVRCAEAGWARKGAPNGRQWYPSISAAELNPQRRSRLGGGPGHEGSSWMRGVKLRVPALGAAVLTLLTAALTATVPAAGAAPAPAGRATTAASAWKIQPTPNPKIKQGRLNAVSCSSPRACTAVGVFDNVPGTGTLAERWDGTSWSIQASPNPAGALTSVLFGVSCPAATFCVAVGNYQNRAGRHAILAEAWNGSSWSLQPTPNGPFGGFLAGVSCPSPAACIAVGGDNNGLPLVEAWNGTSWSIPPTPATGGAQLNSVSCASPSACTAVGSGAFAERWDGTSWSIQPVPGIHDNAALTGVSCTTASACTAVGGSNNDRVTLAEVWNGTSWKIQPTPSTARADADVLFGVSCTSSSACTAVGEFARFGGRPVSLAQRWDGTSWSIQPTPNPLGSGNIVSLSGVSCTSGTACTAVGGFVNSSGQGGTLAEAWDGTSWSIQPTPALPPRDLPGLGGVSCTSASACIAVGSAADTLAEVWNGTAWSVDPTPPSPPSLAGIGGHLGGVWCTSAASCTAVGGYSNSGGNELTLAEARS